MSYITQAYACQSSSFTFQCLMTAWTPAAIEGAKEQPESSPSPSLKQQNTQRPPVCFVSSAAAATGPVEPNISFDSSTHPMETALWCLKPPLRQGHRALRAPLMGELHKLVEHAVRALDLAWPDPHPASYSMLNSCFYNARPSIHR